MTALWHVSTLDLLLVPQRTAVSSVCHGSSPYHLRRYHTVVRLWTCQAGSGLSHTHTPEHEACIPSWSHLILKACRQGIVQLRAHADDQPLHHVRRYQAKR